MTMKLRREAESEMLVTPSALPLTPVRTHCSHAWTLIEMIAVMAVVAILAAILLPVWIKQIDKSVADQEKATLNSLADAFQQYVLSTRVVPDQTTWYAAVASKLGLGTNDVLYNIRQQSHSITNSRVFLIDPALQLGSASSGLPYYQTNFLSGTGPVLPQNPRVMIVSSLGRVLPNTVVSGIFGDTNSNPYFANLWNAADGTVPADTAWSGWAGNQRDVLVQRINLAPLFVRVLMGKFNSIGNAYYCIDGVDGVTTPTLANSIGGYFIPGSILGLYTNSTATSLDTKQILTRDASFLFENGVWRGSLSGSTLSGGIMNIGDLVQQFLLAPPNVNAQNGNAQQALVVSSMLSYMRNYNVWAQGSFNDANLKNNLIAIQADMVSKIQGLYKSPANAPANPTPCLQ
jgi:type II secretory pathway pseudopilin PulG